VKESKDKTNTATTPNTHTHNQQRKQVTQQANSKLGRIETKGEAWKRKETEIQRHSKLYKPNNNKNLKFSYLCVFFSL
jgi:hypothetical protein